MDSLAATVPPPALSGTSTWIALLPQCPHRHSQVLACLWHYCHQSSYPGNLGYQLPVLTPPAPSPALPGTSNCPCSILSALWYKLPSDPYTAIIGNKLGHLLPPTDVFTRTLRYYNNGSTSLPSAPLTAILGTNMAHGTNVLTTVQPDRQRSHRGSHVLT